MKAALYKGPFDILLEKRPDPKLESPSDAVVRVVRACVCGSDLWPYRGIGNRQPNTPIGHEFIGVVEDVGDRVKTVKKGNFVIAPFKFSDGTCVNCEAGWPTSCVNGGTFGANGIDGGQGEAVRVPLADGTLVVVNGKNFSNNLLKSLLTLADVMSTGHHAAVSAGVKKGGTVAVVGDGAVGQCAIIAAQRLGAERIIAMSRNPDRQKLAKEFGATDIIPERGLEATTAALELTGGIGVDAAMECVGTSQAMETAISIVRPGATVGYVGVPHDVNLPIDTMFSHNINLAGGVAPARKYIPELLNDVVGGKINPGQVFDFETDLEGISIAYQEMDKRRAVKSLLNVSEM